MIITFTWYSILITVLIILAAQVGKYFLKKAKLDHFCNLIPLAILLVSFLVYSLVLGKFGLSSLVSALAVTSLSCYTFDLLKSVKKFALNIKIKKGIEG